MKKLLVLLAALAALAGCSRYIPAQESRVVGQDSEGNTFFVSKLFEVDGCRVYRFNDGGYPRYFTNCAGSTFHRESCGKNCNREVTVTGGEQ